MIKSHQRPSLAFFLLAIVTGSFAARIPDIQSRLGIDKAELGLTLIGLAIGSLVAFTAAARLIERIGSRWTLTISIPSMAILLALISFMPSAQGVFAVLFLVGLMVGSLELALNVEIGRIEAVRGKSIMNRAHGFWSVGFFVTSITASVIRQADISIQAHFLTISALVILLAWLNVNGMENAPKQEAAASPERPAHIALPTLALLPLCLIGISACLVEGAGVDWSTIYMRDAFHSTPLVGGTALTSFTLFMAIARLAVDPFVDRLGPRLVARVLLGTAAAGLALVWLAPLEHVALVGFALMGIGCSAVYPMAVSAAAERTDRPSSMNVAAVGQMSFVVFFLAPPVLGFVAEHLGIRQAYLVCLPLVVLSLLACQTLRGKPQR